MSDFIVTRFLRNGDSARSHASGGERNTGLAPSLRKDELIGRVEGPSRTPKSAARASMSAKLNSLIGRSARLARASRQGAGANWDTRQRAIVKVHYFSHGNGGAKALRAHGRYIARDAVARAERGNFGVDEDTNSKADAEAPQRKTKGRGTFYDADGQQVDGDVRLGIWAKTDKRHFRLILAAENGGAIGDLPAYVRDVMQRTEAALGTRLQWVAVDHWDTDNPHTHIVLRGVRDDGRDLIIPKDFVKHGFRSAARDVATERLGMRTREDARLALQREVRAHRPTWLDLAIEAQIGDTRRIRIADIVAPNGNPTITDALKARAQELKRLGMAQEVRRNVLEFAPGWRDRLKAMELHLDIRKSVVRARSKAQTQQPPLPNSKTERGPGGQFGLDR